MEENTCYIGKYVKVQVIEVGERWGITWASPKYKEVFEQACREVVWTDRASLSTINGAARIIEGKIHDLLQAQRSVSKKRQSIMERQE